ncbi:MAG: divergent polysaccharide deacetylase family protein [Fidelibacterota bacterium]
MTYKKKFYYSIALNVVLLAAFLTVIVMVFRPEKGPDKSPPLPPQETDVLPAARGIIVLIIDDFGYRNDEISDGFLALDVPLTCAIIPGHRNSAVFAETAVGKGKEVIIHMPMESYARRGGEDQFVLKTTHTSTELEHRIRKAFDLIPQAVGMNNHQGSKATEDVRVMRVLGLTLKHLGKYFIDSRTTAKTVGESTMTRLGVKTRRRNVFLDNEFDPALIREQLKELAEKAEEWGTAVGIGHAKRTTLEVLQEEIPNLVAQGYQFQFASQAVR